MYDDIHTHMYIHIYVLSTYMSLTFKEPSKRSGWPCARLSEASGLGLGTAMTPGLVELVSVGVLVGGPYMHVYIRIHIHMLYFPLFTFIYIHIHIHIYLHISVCIYIHIYA